MLNYGPTLPCGYDRSNHFCISAVVVRFARLFRSWAKEAVQFQAFCCGKTSNSLPVLLQGAGLAVLLSPLAQCRSQNTLMRVTDLFNQPRNKYCKMSAVWAHFLWLHPRVLWSVQELFAGKCLTDVLISKCPAYILYFFPLCSDSLLSAAFLPRQ